MTASLLSLAPVLPDLTTSTMSELRRRVAAFTATRPPCPDSWCDSTCLDEGDFGDAVIHGSPTMLVPAIPDRLNESDGEVSVRAWRHDSLDDPSECGIELDLSAAKSLLPDCANFSAAQARQLAAALIYAATLIDSTGAVR